jgi:hypothetical protein
MIECYVLHSLFSDPLVRFRRHPITLLYAHHLLVFYYPPANLGTAFFFLPHFIITIGLLERADSQIPLFASVSLHCNDNHLFQSLDSLSLEPLPDLYSGTFGTCVWHQVPHPSHRRRLFSIFLLNPLTKCHFAQTHLVGATPFQLYPSLQVTAGLVLRHSQHPRTVLVVFRVDDSDAIQGRDSGCDSEGVNREKTVNRDSEFSAISTQNEYIKFNL